MKKILLLLTLITFSAFAQNPDYHRYGARTKFVQPDTLSTAQRTALNPKLGTLIYHKDTGVSQWEQWDGDSWEEFGGSGQTETDPIFNAWDKDYNDLINKPIFKVVQNEYENIAALYAGQANQTATFIQYVLDATGFPDVTSGSKYFEYLGTTNGNATDYRLLSDAEAGGIVISDAPYNSITWDNNLDGASKNAIRDRLAIMPTLPGGGTFTGSVNFNNGILIANDGGALDQIRFTSNTDPFSNPINIRTKEYKLALMMNNNAGGQGYALFDGSAITEDRTYTFPNKSGTIALLDDISGGGATNAENVIVSPAIGGNTDAYAVMDDHEDRIGALESDSGINTEFQAETYSATFNYAFDPENPNKYIDLSGNIDIEIFGTVNGDAGNLYLNRGTGNETISFSNGVAPTDTRYVTGTTDVVELFFTHTDTGINWYNNNPHAGAFYESIVSSITTNIDFKNKDFIKLVLEDDALLTATLPDNEHTNLTLHIVNDEIGNHNVVFPSTFLFPQGTQPTLTTTAGRADVLKFDFLDGMFFNTFIGLDYELPEPPFAYDEDAEAFMVASGIPDNSSVFYSATPYEITGNELWLAVDELVKDLKLEGLWSKYHVIYIYIGGTESSHKLNLKNPLDSDNAFRLAFSGTWTHTATGITGDGNTSYANTYFKKTNGWSSNNVGFSFYNQSSGYEAKVDFGVANDSVNTKRIAFITSRDIVNNPLNSYIFNTGNGAITVSNPNPLGFYSSNQLGGSNHKVYKNGIEIGSNTVNVEIDFANVPDIPVYIGAMNQGGTPSLISSRNYSFFSFRDAFDDTESEKEFEIIEEFHTKLNRSGL